MASIGVIGGGIVGTLTAYRLLKKGHSVTVFDGGEERKAASWGNAGFLSPAFGPLSPTTAGPATLLRWLLSPSSVVKVRPHMFLKEGGWLLQYLRKSGSAASASSVRLFREMALESLRWYEAFIEEEMLSVGFKKTGLLEVYLGRRSMEHRVSELNMSKGFGIPFTVLSKDDVLSMEPALSQRTEGGVFYPEDASLEPFRLLRESRKAVLKCGADVVNKDIVKMEKDGNRIKAIHTDDESYNADFYVLATGAYKALDLGFSVPVAAGRGYTITTVPVKEKLEHHILGEDRRLAVSQTEEGKIRASGFFELTAPEAKPDKSIFNALSESLSFYFESFGNVDVVDRWVGSRPCTPDLLPIVGRSSKYDNLLLVIGHCRLGVTLAPYTARLVEGLADGAKGDGRLSPSRFGL